MHERLRCVPEPPVRSHLRIREIRLARDLNRRQAISEALDHTVHEVRPGRHVALAISIGQHDVPAHLGGLRQPTDLRERVCGAAETFPGCVHAYEQRRPVTLQAPHRVRDLGEIVWRARCQPSWRSGQPQRKHSKTQAARHFAQRTRLAIHDINPRVPSPIDTTPAAAAAAGEGAPGRAQDRMPNAHG